MLKKGIELLTQTQDVCQHCLLVYTLSDSSYNFWCKWLPNRNKITLNKRKLTDNTCISSVSGSSVALCVNPAAGTVTNRENLKISFFKKKTTFFYNYI